MPECKGITNAGKPCRSRASADGFCGGHSPTARKKITGRPPAPLPAPIEDLAARYQAGETLEAIAAATGIKEHTLRRRLKLAGVKLRAGGTPKGRGPRRYNWLHSADVAALWEEGCTVKEISSRLGITLGLVYRRLDEVYGNAEARQIRRLYVEQHLPVRMVAKKLGRRVRVVHEKIEALGIEIRGPGGRSRRSTAPTGSVRDVQIAAERRREQDFEATRQGDLTPKQADLLDVLRASPQPLSTGHISRVAEALPRTWRGVCVGNIGACLHRLQARGLAESRNGVETGGHHRGAKILLWLPITEGHDLPKLDAVRQRELQVLIEEQARDDKFGGRRSRFGPVSLDAPITEDGFTILDTLGADDENFAELVA